MNKGREPAGNVDDRHLRLAYKGHRCAVCHRSIAATERRYLTSKGVFDFNQIDLARKSPIYDKLIRRLISAGQLDELDKCNLLRRICHGIWHSQTFRRKLVHSVTLPNGRIVILL